MTTKEHRKPIPLGVKLHACLLLLGHSEGDILQAFARPKRKIGVVMQDKIDQCLKRLGFTDDDIAAGIDWDHQPALGLREIVDGKMVPDPNDPHYIRPMRRAAHKTKTNGGPATTAGSDKHAIAKVKRLTGQTKKRKGPPIRSRGFQKRRKP